MLAKSGVNFRVWAPRREKVEVILDDGTPLAEMEVEPGGYFSGTIAQAEAGTRYRYRLDGEGIFPDPASRCQPDGPHGSSQVIDPKAFAWTDGNWRGVRLEGQVVYEMHVGTFTEEGTWNAARSQLPELASAGISLLEIMPIGDFPGRFGWGYDGVGLFAPTWLYGTPDDLRGFVDQAHANGLGVVLDVVYNHLGPDGNYLAQYSEDYFSDRYDNEWGRALNFDGERSGPVREFFLANAAYWIEEFHFDGLRLDATQQLFDSSGTHIISAIGQKVREAARGRATVLIAENEPQHTKLARPTHQGGYGLDALWNDDFHHSAMVAARGHRDAYYTDYLGKPQEFISAVKYGYLYQGQRYSWQKQRRGAPAWGLRPAQFVNYIQNHDQIANSVAGERLHIVTGPGRFKALTALLLLAPGTPMLFQGQEFASMKPFYYFADHKPEVSKAVYEGRAKFVSQLFSLSEAELQEYVPDPGNPATFQKCKLDFGDRERNAKYYLLHKDLIKLRREDPVFRAQRAGGVDGAVLSEEAFVLRYFGEDGDDRLLLINFGADLHLDPAPEPLLAPPDGRRWSVLWSSEDPQYGGAGTYPPDSEAGWRIPGHAAVALRPEAPLENPDV